MELYKTQEKSSNIKLIIVANVIPKERVLLLSERLVGIKFIEIPASTIINVAKKYSYPFLDEVKPETKIQYKERAINIDEEVLVGKSEVWIFQSNPQTYDILNALGSKEELSEGNSTWLVSRFKDKIKKGDMAIIWMSSTSPKSHDAGIYALAEITTNPEYMNSSSKFWMSEDDVKKEMKNLRVKLNYKILLVNNPILREELKSIPELKDMFIFRQPQGTNFPVRQEEWQVISKLIKDRLNK